jgi:DNA primase
VVASSGTSLTEEQVRLIRRFTPNVLLIYDGDEPGIKASLRAIDLLIPEGMRVKVVILPGSHDPDSYTKAFGAEGFLNYTEKYSQDFLDFKIDRIRPLGDISPDVQADLIQQIAETLAKIPDFVVQQTYLQNAALKLKVREDLLQYAVEKFRKTQFQSVKKSPQEQTIHAINESVDYNALAPLALQEKELIRVILNYSDKSFILKEFSETEEIPVLDFCMQELAELEFVNPVYEQIKNEIFLYYQEHQSFNVNPLIQHEDSRVSNLVSELLLQEFPISEKWFTEYGLEFRYDKRLDFVVQDAVIYYKYRKVLAVLEELLRVIKTATEEMQDELLEKFMYLSQIRNAIEQKKEILGAVKPDDVRD